MRAPDARSLLLFFSSRPLYPFRAHVLFFQSGAGNEWQQRRAGNFSTSASPPPHSPSPSQSGHHGAEESKTVKVAVWWDLENCNVPSDVNVFRVPHRITAAVRAHGIHGPVSITAIGDVSRMSRATQDALYSSGVCLNHVPICGKKSPDRSLLADLVFWVPQNPPPVHFFLISSDCGFANILHHLRMNNYNVLLAAKVGASGALCSSATVMWQWDALARGESLTGRYVNHPPDGLYGSWYGHHSGALDNLFPEPEQAIGMQPEESMEPITDAKTRQIPEALVNGIRQILYWHSEGISQTQLFRELQRINVAPDKDYFGHKKFSHLLLSMPNIVRLKLNPGDSRPLVYGVRHNMMNPIGQSSKRSAGVGVNTVDREQSRSPEDDMKTSILSSQSIEKPSSDEGDMSVASGSNIRTASKEASTLHLDADAVTACKHGDMVTGGRNRQSEPSQSNQMQNNEAVYSEAFFGRTCKNLMDKRGGMTAESTVESESGSASNRSASVGCPVGIDTCNSGKMVSEKEADQPTCDHSTLPDSSLVCANHVHLINCIAKMYNEEKDADCPPAPAVYSFDARSASCEKVWYGQEA